MNAIKIIISLALLQTTSPNLSRHYQDGESVAYQMHGINQGHQRTIRYDARATGVVKKDTASQTFFEEFSWSDLRVENQPFTLSPASQQFREDLSFDPNYRLAIPDLSKVQPILIGPITDLLAFYADIQLAMGQHQTLNHPGDHILIKHGTPNSWADGTYIVFGQDSIDFDITLDSIDQVAHIAKLVIRHLPPAQPQIKFPAPWMVAPVASPSPNNWIEVEKNQDGKFSAQVGMETFQVDLKLSLSTGRLISATMENPVDVLERECSDSALATCGAPVRYTIKRQISLEALNPAGQ